MSPNISQLHFVLIPLMSQGHIIPITDFAKLLAKRGVHVSIVTTPLNAARFDGVVRWASAQRLKIRMIPIRFPCREAGLPDGCENMDSLDSLELSTKFFRACRMLRGPLEDLLWALTPKPSCIVSTNAVPWTQNVADKFGIPRYSFETVSCFTLICSHMISSSDSDSGSDTFLVPNIPHEVEFTKAQLPGVGNKMDSAEFKDIIDEIKRAQGSARGTLVNSFQELEPWYLETYGELRGQLASVWSVGPVSLSEKSNRGERGSTDWLDGMRPKSVVYACFGSLCNISLGQMKEIGSGLEESGFPFVWVIRKHGCSEEVEAWLREEMFEERVEGRGLIIRGWAPQVSILSHVAVGGFLTHCGWNSTLEGICAGVPMITWPMFAEQFYNDKFVVSVLGIGVRVGVERCMIEEGLVTSDRVRSAVESVMDEGDEGTERRRRAEEIAELAKSAVEEGGSSYSNLVRFIQDVIKFHSDDD